MEALGTSLVWRLVELRADVRGALLDAAGMAAAALCAAGRADRGCAVGRRGVLGQLIYGRCYRGGGGGAGGRRGAAFGAASFGRRGSAWGAGSGGPGKQPAL